MAKANTSAYSADPQFQKYYTQILSSMTPQTIEYQAPTEAEIAAQISEYLRPAVDQQIRSRQEATVAQRAATDVDAASRGILASTWVTDIKNRLHQQETADIADAESNYRQQLLEGVFNRQAQEAERANQIAMFNAQMRQQAEKDAYSRAGDMYNLYLQKKKSSASKNTPKKKKEVAKTTEDDEYTKYLKTKKLLADNVAKKLATPIKPDLLWRGPTSGSLVRVGLR